VGELWPIALIAIATMIRGINTNFIYGSWSFKICWRRNSLGERYLGLAIAC
jgi:hypothetical protein